MTDYKVFLPCAGIGSRLDIKLIAVKNAIPEPQV